MKYIYEVEVSGKVVESSAVFFDKVFVTVSHFKDVNSAVNKQVQIAANTSEVEDVFVKNVKFVGKVFTKQKEEVENGNG